MIATCLALATLAVPPLPAPPSLPVSTRGDNVLDHEAIAARWLEAHDRDPAAVVPIDTILEEDFVRISLGPFDVYLPPRAVADAQESKLTVEVIEAVVGAQERWLEWLGGTSEETAANLALLAEWTADLKANDLRKCDVAAGGDLLEALAPGEEVLAAARALSTQLSRGGHLGKEAQTPPTMLIVLPTRADFVEFICVIGHAESDWRHVYWSDGIVDWTHLDYAGRRLIALEFASPGAGEDYEQSIPMKSRNADGLKEHVAQLATRSLLETSYGDTMDSVLAVALANNLVIDLYEEVDTRNDGDTKARSVGPQSVFIAGGNPGGGLLPPANADSRWREKKGKDYFVPVVREAQKQGGKKARSKLAKRSTFLLLDEAGGERFYAQGPFFGAETELPPDPFLADYAEFLRAYRAAFFHWLRENGAGDAEASHAAFATFLRAFAAKAGPAAFPEALAEAYAGVPLSNDALDDDSLEGRFLIWLAKR